MVRAVLLPSLNGSMDSSLVAPWSSHAHLYFQYVWTKGENELFYLNPSPYELEACSMHREVPSAVTWSMAEPSNSKFCALCVTRAPFSCG
jgi:hypothetical protein